MMSEAQAEQDALKYDNAPGLRTTGAVLATVTAPSDVPPAGITPPSSATIGTVAWVVEVSPPSPVAESDCLPTGPTTGAACTVSVSHDYVVLDPTTGAVSYTHLSPRLSMTPGPGFLGGRVTVRRSAQAGPHDEAYAR